MYCHLCRLEVPPGVAHDDTLLHRAAQLIAVTALDRVRSQAFPDTEGTGVFLFEVPSPNPGPQPQTVPTTFSFGTDSPTKEPSPPGPPAANKSGICASTNTPGSKPLMPAEIATKLSFKGLGFATNTSGDYATTNTPGSKPLMPAEIATKPSFKGLEFATNTSGDYATTNTPGSKPLMPAEIATKPSFKGLEFATNTSGDYATTNTPGSKPLMPAEIATKPSFKGLEFATNTSGDYATTNRPGSKPLMPAEIATKPSFKGLGFATNTSGDYATTNTPGSKPLMPAEIATKLSFKGLGFSTNTSGDYATTNTPGSKPLMPAEIATEPSFKGLGFATNTSGDYATTNTPGSKPLMPAEIATKLSFKGLGFATNTSGDYATTNTPGSKPLMPAEIATEPSFKGFGFATNTSGDYATTNTPGSKPLMPAEIATEPSFKGLGFATNTSGDYATTNTPGSKPLMPAEIATIPCFKAPVFGATLGGNDFEWCDNCQQLVAARAYVTHQRSELHIEAAYQDVRFMEAVQVYADEEDLKIIQGSSADGVQLDHFIPGHKLHKVYNCATCDTHFVPVEFKKQHEDSIRHRACLALTAAACRRLRLHLSDGASGDGRIAAPYYLLIMRDLLYAYRYLPTRIKNNSQPLLAPKKYINQISARLERIGTPEGSYTIIVTDDAIIIETAVIMAVDWPRYLGVRAHGEGHMECCACGGIFKNIEEHLKTAEHVKFVLSPIDEQGVRQIDSSDSMCLLCGDKIWSYDVDYHVNTLRHDLNRDIALYRGKMYTKTKEDLKLHLVLKAGTIKIVTEETGEKQDSEVIHNGDKTIGGNQGTVNTENSGGDHSFPTDATKPSDYTE